MNTANSIDIAGGGIAGMSAAITLAKAGMPVVVHERKAQAGGRFWGDLQGIENWTTKTDVLKEIDHLDLGISLNYRALPPLQLIDGQGLQMEFSQKRPLCYLVKRGTAPDTLDTALFKAARSAGVVFNFGSHLHPSKANIVATGPRNRELFAIDTGIQFKTHHPDIAVAIVNDKAAFKGYAYLLIVDGYGCLCTVMFDRFKQIHQHFDHTLHLIKKYFPIDMNEPKKVGGIGSFSMDLSFSEEGRLLVGESAGLQDLLWGFGIRSALSSGVLAARCIINQENYQEKARALYGHQLQASVVVRYLFEKFSNLRGGYGLMGKIANRHADPSHFLHKAYRFTPIHRMIWPWALRRMRKRYPALHLQ